jgi:hypothetical protein
MIDGSKNVLLHRIETFVNIINKKQGEGVTGVKKVTSKTVFGAFGGLNH